jgi:hypothetical protein
MAFMMSYRPFRGGPAMPPDARLRAAPVCHWERSGEGRIVRRWVLEPSAQRGDPPF